MVDRYRYRRWSSGTFYAGSDEIYSAGYINGGFSGGAVVFPVGNEWTVAGMIVNYPATLRPVLRETVAGVYEEIPDQFYEDHTGFVGYQRWSLIDQAIDSATKS